MGFSSLRMDDQQIGAFLRDLEYREQQVREIQYPDKKAASGKLFPIETVSAPWAETTKFVMSDSVGGEFELADDMTTNLSYVDITGKEVTQGIYTFRKGYRIYEKEIARYLHMGIPIEQQKISAVQKLYINTLNRLILFGHAAKQLPGILNHNAFLRMEAPYKLDATSNESQLIATLSAGGEAMWSATEQIFQPKVLVLPPRQYKYLTEQVRLGTSANDTTILPFFLKNNMSIDNIDWMSELQGAGPGGSDMALFYTRNPEYFKVRITDPMRYREYIKEPFGMTRPVAFDYNGIIAYQPYSVLRMYGI